MAQYDSYVLRVWRNTRADGPQWTSRLEHLQGQESRQFTDLEALLDDLRRRIGPESAASITAGDGDRISCVAGDAPTSRPT